MGRPDKTPLVQPTRDGIVEPRERLGHVHALDHPALRSGLITYIGNKRGLVPFINEGLDRIEERIGRIQRMADPFAGSGVVSRLGRIRGAEVTTADVEDYTRPFGRAFIETKPSDVHDLFGAVGGYRNVLTYLNGLNPDTTEARSFFRTHYAPRSTDAANPERERMFFTVENAKRIDAILTEIHERLPLSPIARDILLASVLVEMSIHNNTSGVMKGFHHGWGGRGGDALSRIMAPIELEPLSFIDGPRGTVLVGKAEETVRTDRAYDVVYADPPYNIHQYGANYHLLTSAVRWDDYDPGPVVRGGRAGIRRDHYRSDFCRRRGAIARAALQRFLDAANTRSLLISYNDEGIISPREIFDMLSEDGTNTVELLNQDYAKYRGGKATQGDIKTRENLFIVYRGQRQPQHERERMKRDVELLELNRAARSRFLLPSRWRAAGGSVEYDSNGLHRRCVAPEEGVVELSPELRVTEVTIDAVDASGGLWNRVETCGGTVVDAVEELVREESYPHAVSLLQRLKIKKYRSDFIRIAVQLHGRPLTGDVRRRLERLYTRVTGETLPGDQRRSRR